MWMISGVISILATFVALFLTVKNDQRKVGVALLGIATMILTLLLQYFMVCQWVISKDWTALMDVLPVTFYLLCGYAIIIFILNSIVIFKKK